MTYREFVDRTKAASTQLVRGLRGGRLPSAVLTLSVGGEDVDLIGVESDFFDPEHPERRVQLIERFVVPLIHEREATMVAWSFAAQHDVAAGDTREVLTVVAMDREVHETWLAPLAELTAGTLAAWDQLPPNQQAGRLITPVQEALR
jgi:hypothetical protein